MVKKKRDKISDQIRAAIDGCGESRYRISKQTGIEQSVLSRFMAGQVGMTVETLDKLGAHLGLELVVTREGDRKGGNE